MKNFVAIFLVAVLCFTSCKYGDNNSDPYLNTPQNPYEDVAYDGSYQPESMAPAKNLSGKKNGIDTEDKKDYRDEPVVKTDAKPLYHATVDSDLIINNYEDKRFIKEQIERRKQTVSSEKKVKRSIASQLKQGTDKKISINITEDVSIKDAIMEVSRLTGIDVEVDPDVDGSIILALTNANVSDVLERIAELAELNVSVRNNVVRFTANKPYTHNYSISFLDSTNLSGTNGNSSTSVSSPVSSTTSTNNNATNNNSLPTASLYNNTDIHAVSMWDQFENGLKYIVSQKKGTEYSINKQAGIVTLRAPLSVHKDIEEYIKKIKKVATTQILVEVRLVEVDLEDEFSSGIDFSYKSSNFNTSGTFVASQSSGITGNPFIAALSPSASGNGLGAAVQFLQTFGTTKTISSPRLNVMNNQQARLSFAKDQVYFSLQPQIQNQYVTAQGSANPTVPIVVQSTMKTVPIGVILTLQATADYETNEITMNIHPVLSMTSKSVTDPAATFLGGLTSISAGTKIVNEIPVVEKKELNSTLRIKSGDIMVIGGFNEEKTVIQRTGVPLLKDVPLLRYLFSSDKKYVKNFETVIFIKATIVNSESPITEGDRQFFNDFA